MRDHAVLLSAILAGSVALLLAMPRLSRPDILFGVTVDPSFRKSEAGRKIQRQYDAILLLSGLAAIACALAGLSEAWLAIGCAWVTLSAIAGLVIANSKTKPHARPAGAVREAILTHRDNSLPGGWFAFLMPFGILAAAGAYLAANWERVPERIPTHWGANGAVNGWLDKSPSAVAWFFVTGVAACLICLGSAIAVSRSRRIALRGEAMVNETRFRSVNVLGLLATEYTMALLFAAMPVLSTMTNLETTSTVTMVLAVVTVLLSCVLLVVLIHFGQGGSRLAGSEGSVIGDRTADDRWRWGMFYVNPDDPAFFVEKRFGLGYTLNFGHPLSWWLLGGSLGLMLLGLILAK